MTSWPLVRRTLATLRMAELGFLGVRVMTCRQTPRRNGEFCKAGDFDLYRILLRPLRTSWLMVGIAASIFDPRLPGFRETERGLLAEAFHVATSISMIFGQRRAGVSPARPSEARPLWCESRAFRLARQAGR